MKVSVDGILNTAKELKKQIDINEDIYDKKKSKVKSDRLEIKNILNSRIANIQKELNVIQSSLTKNQIIKDGIDKIKEEIANKGNADSVLDEVKFDKKPVLKEFLGKNISEDSLNENYGKVSDLLDKDVSKLKRLQVEVENIIASNIDSNIDKFDKLVQNLEESLINADSNSLNRISDLKPGMVMELIR